MIHIFFKININKYISFFPKILPKNFNNVTDHFFNPNRFLEDSNKGIKILHKSTT